MHGFARADSGYVSNAWCWGAGFGLFTAILTMMLVSYYVYLRDLYLDPVDAGPLTSARYIEPAGMLCVQLAYGMGMGAKLGMKLLYV
jgi:hypothetical protein